MKFSIYQSQSQLRLGPLWRAMLTNGSDKKGVGVQGNRMLLRLRLLHLRRLLYIGYSTLFLFCRAPERASRVANGATPCACRGSHAEIEPTAAASTEDATAAKQFAAQRATFCFLPVSRNVTHPTLLCCYCWSGLAHQYFYCSDEPVVACASWFAGKCSTYCTTHTHRVRHGGSPPERQSRSVLCSTSTVYRNVAWCTVKRCTVCRRAVAARARARIAAL